MNAQGKKEVIQSLKRPVGEVGQGCHETWDSALRETKNKSEESVGTCIWIEKDVIVLSINSWHQKRALRIHV